MGVVECLNHNMVEPFNVLYEKDGEGMDELVVHNRAVVFPAPGKTFLPSCLLDAHSPHLSYFLGSVVASNNSLWLSVFYR